MAPKPLRWRSEAEWDVVLILMAFADNLVGGFNHFEKYEFVNGKDDIPYMKWKLKNV
jgi:hypothetical protein